MGSAVSELLPGGEEKAVWDARYEKDEEGGWIWGNHPLASAGQIQRLKDTVGGLKSTAFAYTLKDLPGYSGQEGPVKFGMTNGSKPLFQTAKRYSPAEIKVRDAKCSEQLEAGIIRQCRGHGQYASRPTMPCKKDASGQYTDHRFCVDYRGANAAMESDNYPTPLPEELFQSLGQRRFFSVIDMRAGFHQLPLHPESQEVTAFWWGSELYCYNRLPFGIKVATAAFQRVMDRELSRAGLGDVARAFVDDVIIASHTADDHIRDVKATLEALAKVGLRAHPDKSIFMADAVEYLGHLVTMEGLQPSAAKIRAIAALPKPQTKEEVRAALGLLNYYRCYIQAYARIAQPLYSFTQAAGPSKLVWSAEQDQAWAQLKAAFAEEGHLLRRADPDRPFVLHTDWSTKGLGAVLGQVDQQGNEYMVSCISRSLNCHERRYPAWKGELQAAVWGMKMFRPYLHGREFTLVTDHRPLLWLMTSEHLAGQQERWVLAIQDLTFTIKHRPGVEHTCADVPSRQPLSSSFDGTGARLDEEDQPAYKLPMVELSTQEAIDRAVAEFRSRCRVRSSSSSNFQGCAAWASLAAAALAEPAQQFPTATVAAAVLAAAPTQGWAGENEQAEAASAGQQPPWIQPQQWVAAAAHLQGWQQGDSRVPAATLLDTGEVGAQFYALGREEGVVVMELFGGVGAGLEAALQQGLSVKRYLYCDIDPKVRRVAQHRVQQLQQRYPQQLTAAAVKAAFSQLPQDVRKIQQQHLVAAGALEGEQWLVVAGWECQDLSHAGEGQGLAGQRSGLFFELVRTLKQLQQLQEGSPKPAYVLENVDFQNHLDAAISTEDFSTVCSIIGQPIVLDAARFGSRAHRVRNWWTNLAPVHQLEAAKQQVQRQPGLLVSDILENGRQENAVQRGDSAPRYPCNRVGRAMEAWPTLMSHPCSYSFKPGKPGAVWDFSSREWTQPTPLERERAMGLLENSTAAPGVSTQQRSSIIGRGMDIHTLVGVLALTEAISERSQPQQVSRSALPAQQPRGQLFGMQQELERSWADQIQAAAVRAAISSEAAAAASAQPADIWLDTPALSCIQAGQFVGTLSAQDRCRISKRMQLYSWQHGKLWRTLADGTARQVPEPQQREQVVRDCHNLTGHFGARRTTSMLASAYWWYGMTRDVQGVISRCSLCDRGRASYNPKQPQLQPLPIEPLFYRWGVDLADLSRHPTAAGNKYVLIAVEHFSKYMELVPLPNKEPATTASAFAQLIGRFAAPAEVLTDAGGEWRQQFDQLLERCFVEHRRTSGNHPQANGLAERCVQTTKRALSKLCEQEHSTDWDEQLPWVALGYNCSTQQSTGFSPYELLFARQPIISTAAKQLFQEPLSLDSAEAASQHLMQRVRKIQREVPIAMANLKAAQQRDCRRYEAVRRGDYVRHTREYRVGDYVYWLRDSKTGLLIRARPTILRVKRVKGTGVLVLEGRCGRTMELHANNVAPCHLPDIDGTVDPTLQACGEDKACEVCGERDNGDRMLLCDWCNGGWHTFCLDPMLQTIPEGDWVCDICRSEGITIQHIQQRRRVSMQQQPQQQQQPATLWPDAAMKARDQRAKELDGMLVTCHLPQGDTWGRVEYLGPQHRPRYFKIWYADGSWELATHRAVTGKRFSLQPAGTQPPAATHLR